MPGAGWAECLVCMDCLREALKTLVVDPRKGPVWQKAKCRPRMGGGAGLPMREALLPARSRPPALGIHLGFTGLKSSLPTDVQGEGSRGCLAPCFPCEAFSRKPSLTNCAHSYPM